LFRRWEKEKALPGRDRRASTLVGRSSQVRVWRGTQAGGRGIHSGGRVGLFWRASLGLDEVPLMGGGVEENSGHGLGGSLGVGGCEECIRV
jgi:hypothetical protein